MMKGRLSQKMAAVTVFALFFWAIAMLAAPAGAVAPQVRFEHWLNVSEEWHTGAINQNNSDYVEGDVVPHRILFQNFEGEVTFAFTYEYEDSKIPAYGHDYLADVNATESSTLVGGLTTSGVFRYMGMTVVTIVGPTVSEHGDRLDHSYVVTATFGGEDAYFYYGAHLAVAGSSPGHSDHLGASSWHGGNLENRFDEDGPEGPRGDRTLSMKVEPGEPDDEYGRIVVGKTVPGVFDEEFEFAPSYGPHFRLSDGESNDSGPLSAGTYTVEELVSSLGDGWYFHGIDCQSSAADPRSSWSEDGAEVEVTLAAGETVTCTFENRSEEGPQFGSITVIKTTSPGTAEMFAFEIAPSGSPKFSLKGRDDPSTEEVENRRRFELASGEYEVAEVMAELPDGYRFHSVSCTGGDVVKDGAMVVIDLELGDDYVCTFENRRGTTPPTRVTESGEIRIVKMAAGTERFAFQASWKPDEFTLAHGETLSSGSLAPGTYQVHETISAAQAQNGWSFTGATCSNGSPVSAVRVNAGEIVTCTFNNAQVMAEVVVATTTITSVVQVADVVLATLPFTGTNAVGVSMIALFVMALGGLVVLAATPVRQD